jgi:GH35 family endo-1,4-beta-xylanase
MSQHKQSSRKIITGAVCLAGWIVVASPVSCPAVETVLSNFNGTGFTYTFDGFTAQTGPTAVRLFDTTNGWGGAGNVFGSTQNLSAFADGRWVVDLTANPPNGVNNFTLELYDTSNRSGKWSFSVGGLTPGVPTTLTSSTTLANPTDGTGDWHNLDLSQINQWLILGEWQSPALFDISFDRVKISTTADPPPPYAGAEPNAPWRAEAVTRIDAIRKADLRVTVTDAAGNPVPNADVGVHMQQHEFSFGSAVQAYRLRDNNPAYDTYKQKVAELFNMATIENNLKWPAWNGEWGSNFTQQGAANAIDWLNDHQIKVRGHNLIWPGYANLPQTVKNVLDGVPLNAAEQQQLRNLIASHIADIAGEFAGELAAWDVINEPRTNHDVMDNLSEGNLAMVHWFQQARAADATAKLYLNDYGILSSGGGTNTVNQQVYYDTIEYLVDNGAPIDGVGFQGHFSADSLTGPVQLWTIFDRFAALGLDMQITEFDLPVTDEQLQAQYLRDLMTAVFAHDGLNAFVMWGFWEGASAPNAGMFRNDWSIKPSGQEYLDLVFNQWWTDEDVSSDPLGEALVRAFKGEHDVSASFGEFSETLDAFLGDGGLDLEIVLPFLLGDFNRNGKVDAADYVVWRRSLGTSVTPGTAADGNNDGQVTMADLNVWKQHFGESMPAGFAEASVPESSSNLLLLIGMSSGFAAFRRR